jgi:ribosomal protein S18 acetylase RimI-like enzyme
VRIERVTDAAGVEAAGPLLDRPPAADATRRFLADPGHHLLVAYEADVPAGFVTGVEMTHPDKGTEMFLYELGVAEGLRSRGIGRSLVAALAQLARDRGCYGMWVLTDPGNAAAQTAYSAAGGVREADQAVITWTFTTAAG